MKVLGTGVFKRTLLLEEAGVTGERGAEGKVHSFSNPYTLFPVLALSHVVKEKVTQDSQRWW